MSDFSSIYNKHTWKNGQSPALNDSNLNDIETFMEIVDERTRDLDTRQTAITPEVVAGLVLAPTYAAEASEGARTAERAAAEARGYRDEAEKIAGFDGSAATVSYDGSASGISANTVQDAIDKIGTNVILLTSADNLDDIIDPTKTYTTANINLPQNAPTNAYNLYIEVKFDSSITSPRRRQIAYAVGANIRWERVRNYQGAWGAWVRTDMSSLIIVETKTYSVSYDAGTIGTRCVSENVTLNKSGYTPIAISIVSVSDSSKFSVNLMINPSNGLGQIKCYRATTAAASNVTLTYSVTYLRN